MFGFPYFRTFVFSHSRTPAPPRSLSYRSTELPVEHGAAERSGGPEECDTPMATSPRRIFGPLACPARGSRCGLKVGGAPTPRILEIAVTTPWIGQYDPSDRPRGPRGRGVSFAALAPCSHPRSHPSRTPWCEPESGPDQFFWYISHRSHHHSRDRGRVCVRTRGRARADQEPESTNTCAGVTTGGSAHR